jgi:hypothetical protein
MQGDQLAEPVARGVVVAVLDERPDLHRNARIFVERRGRRPARRRNPFGEFGFVERRGPHVAIHRGLRLPVACVYSLT